MDQTWSDSSQAFVQQHCAFPTISRALGKTLSYKTVRIFDDDSVSGQEGPGNAEFRKGLLPIWAILLRFYAVNDIVAFLSIVTIPDESPKNAIKDAESKTASRYSRIHMCYDIPDHIRLCDVKVASRAFYKAGEKNATVNTAFACSNPPSSGTAGVAGFIEDLLAERHVCLDLLRLFSLRMIIGADPRKSSWTSYFMSQMSLQASPYCITNHRYQMNMLYPLPGISKV